jgi:hypothetical protein
MQVIKLIFYLINNLIVRRTHFKYGEIKYLELECNLCNNISNTYQLSLVISVIKKLSLVILTKRN